MILLILQPEKNAGIGNKSVVTTGNIREEGLIKESTIRNYLTCCNSGITGRDAIYKNLCMC